MTAYAKNASVAPHLVDDRDPPAIAQLKGDHQIFRALFDLVDTVGKDVLFPIARELCIRLAIHMNLEEEFLYPSLKIPIDVAELDDAMLEHQLARRVMSDIMEMGGREASLRRKVRALGEQAVRHVNKEDRELLPDARAAWERGKLDLLRIGVQMQSRRRALFTLVGSAAAETRPFDVDLPNAVERLQRSPSADGKAWPGVSLGRGR